MKKNIIFILSTFIWFQILNGQQFSFTSLNPYGLEYLKQDSIQAPIKLIFNDMDADGDEDVILVGFKSEVTFQNRTYSSIKYFIDKQVNTGTKLHPVFSPREPFMNEFPYPDGLFAPAAGDLNLDGKLDFIVCCGLDSSLNLKPQYYERKSTIGNEQFKIEDSDSLRLRNFSRGGIFIPELEDMDKDGDLDLLMSGFQSEMVDDLRRGRNYMYLYAKNIGTLSQPKFDGWYPNPYGLIPADNIQYSIVGDIDNDNDNDILSLFQQGILGKFSFIENIPQTDGKPTFLAGIHSPFGLPMSGAGETFFGHTLVDIDGDGDLDLFVIQELENTGMGIGYYENNLCTPSSLLLSQEICSGDSVIIGSYIFKTTGNHYVTIEKPNRCDSVIHLSLTVMPLTQINLQGNICEGEVYTIGNTTFEQSGQYVVSLTNHVGCDSIIHLNLTVLPKSIHNLTLSLCDGENVTIGTQTFSQTGQYEVTLQNSNGCDSIIYLNLMVNPKATTNIIKTLCDGDVYTVGNQQFTQTGQYEVQLSTVFGCDSLVNHNLTFIKLINTISQFLNTLKADQSEVMYQWFDCSDESDIDGATLQTFMPTESGSYGVKIMDNNGCMTVSACFPFILTKEEQVKIADQIILYPNPTAEYFSILNHSDFLISQIVIRDDAGRLLKSIPTYQIERISTAGLPNGNYTIEMIVNKVRIEKKLSIIR
ncbi:MAG: T9SS type A sorting domain-containing protein [Saprospiraceae bacterium]